ncbi:MAG: APC family permease [Caulobacteraceae bacterium]|nr:APC family permease [Caulobacter sp.]
MAMSPTRLARRMALPGVLFLTLSAATPASSVFIILPDVIRQAGTGAVLALTAAAAVALLVALAYAELGSAFPHAGGEYVMTGLTLGSGAGFVVLVLNLLNSLLTGAVFALGVADYLHALWPAASALGVAFAVVGGCTALGLLDIRAGAWVTGGALVLELAAVAAVSALGLAHPARGASALLHPVSLGAPGLGGAGLAATPALTLALSGTAALFAFDGYGSAVYFAEETRDVRRRLAWAVLLAWGLTVAAEIAPAAAVLLGARDLPRLLRDPAMMGGFVRDQAGGAAAAAVELFVAAAVANAVAALVLLSARQVYATARDGAWPAAASRLLGRVDPVRRAPAAATLLTGAAMAALALLPLRLLLILTGTSITLIYAALQLALIAGRRRGATAGARFRSPLGVAGAGLALAACAGVLAADAMDATEGRPSLAISVALAAAAWAWWALALRPRGWAPRPPEAEEA